MGSDKQKDPEKKDIEFILDLLSKKKFIDAKNKIDDLIIDFSNSSVLFNILGAFYSEQNKLEEAIANYKKAIKIKSTYAQVHNNLGIALHKLNKLDEAIKSYKVAISLNDSFAEAYNNLGSAMREVNNLPEALEYLKKATKVKPNYFEAFNNLGGAYQESGNNKEALNNFKKAIEIRPNYPEAYNGLGLSFESLAMYEESLSSYEKAIKLNPSYEKPYNNIANLLGHLGKYDEATLNYHKAIKIKPDYAKAYSNLLFNLNYKTNFSPNIYLYEAKKFRANCKPKKKLFFKYQYDKNPKKLKVGLVSADFGNHPGGYFTLSTLKELKNKKFEFVAYATTNRKDEFSDHFKPLFSKWNLIEKKKDEEIVEDIFKEGIHILIDLQGHSSKNKLPIFMHKAAPIQVSWLAQGSTGINEIDYFIGSSHITPAKEENHYVEKIWRLPEISQCFTPPFFDVQINKLPALENNFFTFGSINKLTKVSDDTVNLWSSILKSIPNSKLLLKNKDFENNNIRENTYLRFSKHNINKDRLILEGEAPTRSELLETYNKIDIALDTFPFQGNTTTCEAAWMGVPVLTLKGDRYLFHFGESINSNLGMQNWIARDYEEYISKAIRFSSDLKELKKIRSTLRETALKSPVFNAVKFANNFSKMLWEMWAKLEKKDVKKN